MLFRSAAANATLATQRMWHLLAAHAVATEEKQAKEEPPVYTRDVWYQKPDEAWRPGCFTPKQQAYEVQADMVCYGKTLGGGLPVGVLCGKKDAMTRSDPKKVSRVAYVIGTFAAHPLTMGAMNEFLRWVTTPEAEQVYAKVGDKFEHWVKDVNEALDAENLPLSVHNLTTVWTIIFNQPGRYHWMFQYYLRAEGIALSWVGTGRLLVSLDFVHNDFEMLKKKLMNAARAMREIGRAHV